MSERKREVTVETDYGSGVVIADRVDHGDQYSAPDRHVTVIKVKGGRVERVSENFGVGFSDTGYTDSYMTDVDYMALVKFAEKEHLRLLSVLLRE